jgi:hypothetical protein
MRWCWFSRPPSTGGTAIGSFAGGGAVRDVLGDHASIRRDGELLKLGVVVSERTVSRYLGERPKRPSQTWRTFIANHLGQSNAIRLRDWTLGCQMEWPLACSLT